MKLANCKSLIVPLLLFIAFILVVENFNGIAQILSPIIPQKEIFVERTTLREAAIKHISIVALSSLLSILIAMIMAMTAKLTESKELREFLFDIATIGQTIPTVAVIAIIVPLAGYGAKPVLIAMLVYGILPVFRNAVEGFNVIPEDVGEAAKALGLSKMQTLFFVEIPLAMPAIIAGVRTSVIINISVATIGATIGASGFGTFIVNGMRSNDTMMILKGAIPVSLLALAVDSLFSRVGNVIAKKMPVR